jgi:hypothetical protein
MLLDYADSFSGSSASSAGAGCAYTQAPQCRGRAGARETLNHAAALAGVADDADHTVAIEVGRAVVGAARHLLCQIFALAYTASVPETAGGVSDAMFRKASTRETL